MDPKCIYKPVPLGEVEGHHVNRGQVGVRQCRRQRGGCRPFLWLSILAVLLFGVVAGILLISVSGPSNSRRLVFEVDDSVQSGGKTGRNGDLWKKITEFVRGTPQENGVLRIKQETVANMTELLQLLKEKVGSGTLGVDVDGLSSKTNIGNINVFNINVVNSNNNNNNNDLNNDRAQNNNNVNNLNNVVNSVNNNVNNLVNSNDGNNSGNNNNNFNNNNDGNIIKQAANETLGEETTTGEMIEANRE